MPEEKMGIAESLLRFLKKPTSPSPGRGVDEDGWSGNGSSPDPSPVSPEPMRSSSSVSLTVRWCSASPRVVDWTVVVEVVVVRWRSSSNGSDPKISSKSESHSSCRFCRGLRSGRPWLEDGEGDERLDFLQNGNGLLPLAPRPGDSSPIPNEDVFYGFKRIRKHGIRIQSFRIRI